MLCAWFLVLLQVPGAFHPPTSTFSFFDEILKVTGMSCGGCVGTIEGALNAVPGVANAKVSLANHEATVTFSERQTSHEQLQLAIEKAGYGVEKLGATAPAPTISPNSASVSPFWPSEIAPYG